MKTEDARKKECYQVMAKPYSVLCLANKCMAWNGDEREGDCALLPRLAPQPKEATSDAGEWDQERLVLIRGHYSFFDAVFRSEYRPVGGQELATAMAMDPTFAEAIKWARKKP